MRVRAGAIGVVAASALAAPAIGQAPALPVGNLGGGTVLAPPHDPYGAGNAVLGLRALAGGRLQIEATVPGACGGGSGGGTFPAHATAAADGAFVAEGTTSRTAQGLRLKTTFRISGTLTATGVDDGSARATTEISAAGRRTLRCTSGAVAFKARRPSTEIGTPGAAPSSRYYGFTSERRNGPHRGIVLRISKDGRSVTRALYATTLRCNKVTLPDIVDTPRRSLSIDAAGKISDRVRSTFKDKKTVVRSDERFDGTLGSLGANGTLSITERTTSRKTGKLLDTCRTGSLTWAAAR